jgi:uncharacterized Zn finger protein (UPF0148 family)
MGTVLKAGDTCPKCGLPINWIERKKVNGHIYYVAAHVMRDNGKRVVKRCYLGAERYTYVTGQHLNLGIELKGMVQEAMGESRLAEYLRGVARAVESQLEDSKLAPAKAVEIAKAIEELQPLAAKLRHYAEAKAEEAKEGGKQ